MIFTQSKNFNEAWEVALAKTLEHGEPLVFGSKEEPKKAIDACHVIELSGGAIEQIEKKEVHPLSPFGGARLREYCKEFTPDYLSAYMKRPPEKKFSYLYYERLKRYDTFIEEEGNNGFDADWMDQLYHLKQGLQKQIESNVASNRYQAITWYPDIDGESTASPCLQRIWLRHQGNLDVDVHLSWRSRDLYGAWQANLVALVDMLYREILDPNSCVIRRIVDMNDSLHIYETDVEAAKTVIARSNPFVVRH